MRAASRALRSRLAPLAARGFADATGPLKRTPLFDYHVAHGGKMVPFAGWEMVRREDRRRAAEAVPRRPTDSSARCSAAAHEGPTRLLPQPIQYKSSIMDSTKQCRSGAALFDVSHMCGLTLKARVTLRRSTRSVPPPLLL
jgi:aminomethyltransferase